jgi:D-alanine-D-alanine ligase-like ATP-grasp enzyme
MTKLRVGLLFGGRSGEHEVSLKSAKAISGALSAGANAQTYGNCQPKARKLMCGFRFFMVPMVRMERFKVC